MKQMQLTVLLCLASSLAGCSDDSGGKADGGASGFCPAPNRLASLPDATDVQDLAADATTLYFITRHGTTGTVQSVPLAGGTPTKLADQGGLSLVVDDTNVFFVDATTVWRVAKTGGTPEKVAVNALGHPQGHALAVDDTYVYFNGSGLVRVAKTSSSASSPQHKILWSERANSLVLLGDTIYYTTDHTLKRGPKAGGTPTSLASGLGALEELAVCGDSVYTVDHGKSLTEKKRVLRVAAAGGDPTELASYSGGSLGAVACDGSNVYFSPENTMAMSRVPAAGGTAIKVACPGGTKAIIAGSALYWIDYDPDLIDRLPL